MAASARPRGDGRANSYLQSLSLYPTAEFSKIYSSSGNHVIFTSTSTYKTIWLAAPFWPQIPVSAEVRKPRRKISHLAKGMHFPLPQGESPKGEEVYD